MLQTVDVELLSDSACERILAEKEENAGGGDTDLQTVQASTFETVKEIARQDWVPWAVAGGVFVLWATKRKRGTR